VKKSVQLQSAAIDSVQRVRASAQAFKTLTQPQPIKHNLELVQMRSSFSFAAQDYEAHDVAARGTER
jgi:hypothetical protein